MGSQGLAGTGGAALLGTGGLGGRVLCNFMLECVVSDDCLWPFEPPRSVVPLKLDELELNGGPNQLSP